jgi:PKD repeat protein
MERVCGVAGRRGWAIVPIAIASLAVLLVGCPIPTGPGEEPDLTDVTGLTAASGPGQVLLEWTDPTESGFEGISITWSPGGSIPVEVDPGVETYTAAGLTNGTEHTFTVVANYSGGDSDGVTVTATPTTTPPVANITRDPTGTVLVGESVEFDGSESTDSDGAITAYAWDFDDSSPAATTAIASHSFAAAGTYDVSLQVTDNDGATDTAIESVYVNAPPVAVIVADTLVVEPGGAVDFASTGSSDSNGTIVSYAWDFGDSSTDNVADPAPHTYTTLGEYAASLTVTDNDGATDTDTVTIYVSADPVAIATASTTTPIVGETVDFTGSGSADPDGTIVSYDWDFGDGGTSTAINPSHSYMMYGTFTVTLTVTDDDSNTDTDSLTIYVNDPPSAIASVNEPNPITGESVDFSSTGSTDVDGTITSFEWDFGDGETSTDENPSHSYASYGEFTITLTVTDDDGAIDIDSLVIIVDDPPVAVATVDNDNPDIDEVINFTGSGSTDADGSVVSYVWDFGDTNISTAADPSHSYSASGEYTVTLTVTDDDGHADSDTLTVTVNDPPTAVATVSDDTPNVGDEIDFTGSGSTDADGTIVSYEWDFGDTNTSTDADPGHTYAAGGEYTVTLTVTDNNGATDSDTLMIDVNELPVAAPSVDDDNPVVDDTINFTGDASSDPDGTVEVYSWNFGDGVGTSTDANPSYSYSAYGEHTVTLTVTDNDGGTDFDTLLITVDDPPVAVATVDNDHPLASETINFTGSGSTDADGEVVSYDWDFGDTNSSTDADPSHSYAANGEYTVTLTVTDDDGHADTDTLTIYVNALPTADAGEDQEVDIDVSTVVNLDGEGTDTDGTITGYSWSFVSVPPNSELEDADIVDADAEDASFDVGGEPFGDHPGDSWVYVLELTVTDNDGGTDTDQVTITLTGSVLIIIE